MATAASPSGAITGRFSDEVEKALAEVLPSDDPLDQPDFDPVEYINARFPTEQSLSGLAPFITELKANLEDTEKRLLDAVRVQATTATTAARDLEHAKGAVADLHSRVSDIKMKAESSERMVTGICDSIRHLDTAKGNLSSSIKTLRNVQLYVIALQNLTAAYEAKDYTRCNDSLRAAQGYREKFKPLDDTPKIKELGEKLTNLERQLEFHLRNHAIGDIRPGQTTLKEDELREACLVVDALGKDVRQKVRAKFIATQLEAYGALFRRGTEEAALEKTERRFAFIRKLLESNERFFLRVFPRHWCVPQELCVEFCLRTHKDIAHQLREEAGAIDIAVLVFILQRTMEAEKDLTQRVRHLQAVLDEAAEDDDLSFDPKPRGGLGGTMAGTPGGGLEPIPEYKYYGLIVRCFDPHMGQYVQHEDRMLQRTIAENVAQDSVIDDLLTLQSAQDLFLFIQESKRRASTFAQPHTMAELADVWLRHLASYARMLAEKVTAPPTTPEQMARLCVTINSADYCRSATDGLCEDLVKLTEGEAENLQPQFEECSDSFVSLSSIANASLVQAFTQRLGQHVNELQTFLFTTLTSSNDHAHNIQDALDESPMSLAMRRTYTELVELAARNLTPPCFPFLLNKTMANFLPNVWANALYKPRGKHSHLSVSQLRIDAAALERWLLSVPTEVIARCSGGEALDQGGGRGGTAPKVRPSGPGGVASRASVLGSGGGAAVVLTAYTRTVRRETSYLAAALKVMQLQAGEQFVDLYYQVTPAERRSVTDCQRLLELKGVRREDTRQLLAALRRRGDVPMDIGGVDPRIAPVGTSATAPPTQVPAPSGQLQDAPPIVVTTTGSPNTAQERHGDPQADGLAAPQSGGRFSSFMARARGSAPAAATAAQEEAVDAGEDGPGAGLRRKFRDMTAGSGGSFMSRLKK